MVYNAGFIDVCCESVDPIDELPVNDSLVSITEDPLLDGYVGCDGYWPIHQSGPGSREPAAVTLTDLYDVVERLPFRREDERQEAVLLVAKRKREWSAAMAAVAAAAAVAEAAAESTGEKRERVSFHRSAKRGRPSADGQQDDKKRKKGEIKDDLVPASVADVSASKKSSKNSVALAEELQKSTRQDVGAVVELRELWHCRGNWEARVKLGEAAAKISAVERREKAENRRMRAEEIMQKSAESKHNLRDSGADAELATTLSGANSVEAEPGQPARSGSGVLPASFLKTPSPLVGFGNTSPSTTRCTPPVLSQNAKTLKLAESRHPQTALHMQTPIIKKTRGRAM